MKFDIISEIVQVAFLNYMQNYVPHAR